MIISRRRLLTAGSTAFVRRGRRRAVRGARPAGRVHLQVRQQSADRASDERPGQGDGGGDQGRDQWPVRPADLPEQPARLRHRHAEPDPLGRRRVLHAVRPDPVDAGAGGLDQRHRLRVPGLRHGLEGHGRRTWAPMSAARSPRPTSWPWTRSGTTASARPRRRPSRSTRPDDLKGFKIRVPVSPLWTSMFKAFDAAPASINFSEVYSALQTKIVDGQENPLAIISTAKLYEVQKYLLADQPHVGRLLVPGQPPRLGAAARRMSAPSSPSTSTRPA